MNVQALPCYAREGISKHGMKGEEEKRMRRGMKQVLTGASLASLALISASAAYGVILPGNFWPNPTLEDASTTEANAPNMGVGGTWRRGGGDFGVPTNPGP